MRVINRRTTALGVGLVATLVSSAILVGGVSAAARKAVPRLVFPVVGPVSYKDDFGDPRAKWPHPGNDLMAEKRQIAVAAEAGKIEYWTRSPTAGCMLYLFGKSGTSYQYIHLNNDLTGGNDNRGKCVAGTAYAPGLKDGASVRAGQAIGFVGDSGDANGIHPHLHFEVHPGNGPAVDPYPYLQSAQPLLFYAKQGTKVSLRLKGTIVSSLAGSIDVQASQVQAGSSKPVTTDRQVSLAVAPNAVISSPHLFGAVDALLRGVNVDVKSAPLRTTLAVERGDAGSITASYIDVG